jgi:hypothetical protein
LEAEARAGLYSLYCCDQWKPKSEGLDMHIWLGMTEEPTQQMRIDQMVPRHAHDKPFTVRTFWISALQPGIGPWWLPDRWTQQTPATLSLFTL